jgi:hypothetical protein
MKKYEYKTFEFNSIHGIMSLELNSKELDKILNNYGQDGWELVSASPIINNGITRRIYYTMKRIIE